MAGLEATSAQKLRDLLPFACAALILVVWGEAARADLLDQGLFRWIGVDFANYRSQAAAFVSAGPRALYDLEALRAQLEPLGAYTTAPNDPLQPGPVPFPPIYAWALIAFAIAPPPIGLALWSGLNLLAAAHLARRAASLFPISRRRWAAVLAFTAFPVLYAIWCGQPSVLLACAVGEAYLSLRSGKDFRGGLWLACLLIKPQYGLLVGPLLLWKRRWSALAGAIAGVAAILGASLLVAGPALLSYPLALRELSDFRGTGTVTAPYQMINWRGLVLIAAPHIRDRDGILLVAALGALTVVAAAFAWRGPWAAESSTFPSRMVILVMATLLANYHSHVHGAALLVVPVAAMLASNWPEHLVPGLTKALLIAPPVPFLLSRYVILADWLFLLLLLATYLALIGMVARTAWRPAPVGTLRAITHCCALFPPPFTASNAISRQDVQKPQIRHRARP